MRSTARDLAQGLCRYTVEDVDLYQVRRAAGKIEALLGLAVTTKYENPKNAGGERKSYMISTERGLELLTLSAQQQA